MKKLLTVYPTCALVICGFLMGVSLRDLIAPFDKSHHSSKTGPREASAAGRVGFLDSNPRERAETAGFNRSAPESLGSAGSDPRERDETTVFKKSAAESFGFLEYTDAKWERKKKVHARQSTRQHGPQSGTGRVFFQNNWEPSWSCGFEQRIGRIGDGGKWVCDAYLVSEASECNVLSVGSNHDWSFETSVHELNPRCKIHTFDHTSGPAGKPDYVHFYATGLGPAKIGSVQTMDGILEMAGLHNKTVDLMKIDCEGCELEVYPQFTAGFIRQVLVEIHMPARVRPAQVNNLFEHMQRHGYVIFHKEPNTLGCSGDCIEYGFLKLNLPV